MRLWCPCRFAGLEDGAPFDLLLCRDHAEAEIVCEVVSADEGRHLNRDAWFRLADRIDPDLQTCHPFWPLCSYQHERHIGCSVEACGITQPTLFAGPGTPSRVPPHLDTHARAHRAEPLVQRQRVAVTEADVRLFLTLEARDPTLATMVRHIRTYSADGICFGMRYMDAITIAESGRPVAGRTRINALEPDLRDH